MTNIRTTGNKPSTQFWILAIFLGLTFATGGASRVDAQSLIVLRPFSVFVCAIALITLRVEHLKQYKFLTLAATYIFGLALLHLIPLPPSLWNTLPGRAELADVDSLTGIQGLWRPLTISPFNGWHALLSLFVPTAVLLLGVQLNRDDLFRLLPLLIALAAISGFLGLLQAIGDPQSALYFYRITNNGSAVGLFANRNHAATLLACLFPMLAVFASTAKGATDRVNLRQLVSASIAIILVPLILVTGSRSGLICALIGILCSALLYRRPIDVRIVRKGSPSRFRMLPILLSLSVISLGFLTYFFSRAQAIERLFLEASVEDNRTDFWAVSLDLLWKYFPWGSGSGSFVEVFQIIEPTNMLDATYLNRAHNDWLEIAITFGLPGIISLAAALTAFVWRSFYLWCNSAADKRYVIFGRLSSVCVAIIAVASISDYPLRTPTMMAVMAVFSLWLTQSSRENGDVAMAMRQGH